MRLRIPTLVCAMSLLPLITLAGQKPDDAVVHGTINIALGNENGLVVLTDSMITDNGRPHPEQPSQKLFKLDDRTVCAIAGFAAANAISAPPTSPTVSVPDLNSSTSAIIHEYVRQSSTQSPQSIIERRRTLASLMNHQLSSIANVRDALGNPTPINGYRFQLIVAGYDIDDKPKIGRITLETKNEHASLMSSIDEASITDVEEKLVYSLNGMPDIAAQVLLNPESKPNDAVINEYATSLRVNGGRSLTIEQMTELAKRLAFYTARAHPEVGGPNQIAVLQKQQSVRIEQQKFPDPPRPLFHFGLVVNSHFSYSSVGFAGGVSYVFVRCSWAGMKQEIDGNYFINNDFQDSFLLYDGGAANLGQSNRVVNSKLIVGPSVKPDDMTLKQLTESRII